MTISIGIAAMDPNGADFEASTQRADAALYEAKTGGRNRVCAGSGRTGGVREPRGEE